MVKRSVVARVRDMLRAIDGAMDIIEGMDLGSYRQSFPTRMAIERCIEIVSEASRGIPVELTEKFPDVPWPEIRAIGNVLRHDYGIVDDLVIWRVATKSLPELKPVIEALLTEAERENS